MRKIDYDEKDTASTENHLSVDTEMKEVIDHPGSIQDHAFVEGFAASSGVRQESAETGGRLDHTEILDELLPDSEPMPVDEENAGLADS